ncbi:S-adenosyl-L-methionine-dependent methyltransferase [Microdochium trichocladiopsis]|uniref:S-adenosyl-L-methionine-dependent methyltransferase n=1 Tax=Microdochium trichocladiopsis TaxID=1682393 RepID=A0A9P8Y0S9_9PEZI|nr:S-adenosyl-L-methionine-dependent methyltransferase [Microdochium trichocladiopsis]KAH7027748.1 S-adenosyl-L-methionine-dependent methyltransferase [Microdochium trichocladiopsis]
MGWLPAPLLPDGTRAPYLIENGRCYTDFKPFQYLFPCDSDELNRLDIFHKLITLARNGTTPFAGLHKHPLPPDPKIIDLGCGSGIWAVDMADRYGPNSEVVGLDLSMHQPKMIPPWVSFLRLDFEEDKAWQHFRRGSQDLIRGQMLLGSVSDWPALYLKVLQHLKPETGIFEQIEIDFMPLLEEGELPPDSKLGIWARGLRGAMINHGRPIEMDPASKAMMESVGFADVHHECIRIPYNTWPSDKDEKLLGRWFNLGMNQGIAGLTLAPFTRYNGYSYDDVMRLIADVKREMCDRQIRTFCHLHIYTARRPRASV